MKNPLKLLSVKPSVLRWGICAAGALGFVLRTALYLTGVDEKGLLVTGHWAATAVWILTAAAVAAIAALTREISGPERYADCFPVSAAPAVGAGLAALGTLITAIMEIGSLSDIFDLVSLALGIAAAVSFALVAVCRLTGGKPYPVCHILICVYFAVRLFGLYRVCGTDPQLMDFLHCLAAFAALMMNAYYHAALEAGSGKPRAVWTSGLLAVFLCPTALYGCEDTIPLLTGGVWAAANLPETQAKPRRERPKLVLSDEPDEDDAS